MSSLSTYLLAVIAVMFLLQLFLPSVEELFIFDPKLALAQPWRFLTSIFLHGGLLHIFFNSYALFMFGSILESRISGRDYLAIFFGAGLTGSLLYFATYLAGIIPPIPALGASGAIYGILGAVAIVLPDMRIFMWFFPMKMKHAAIFWVALETLGTFDISSGIASAAHLGGLIFGLAYAFILTRGQKEHRAQSWEWEQP
jgi:hypothetical protein